jgi:hypothetical protein
MLSKCANPGCRATFLYLHQGKLFRFDTSIETLARTPVSEMARSSRRVEFFWLCEECAQDMTLTYNRETGIKIVPLTKEFTRAQSA